jgi:hypothetical protein
MENHEEKALLASLRATAERLFRRYGKAGLEKGTSTFIETAQDNGFHFSDFLTSVAAHSDKESFQGSQEIKEQWAIVTQMMRITADVAESPGQELP